MKQRRWIVYLGIMTVFLALSPEGTQGEILAPEESWLITDGEAFEEADAFPAEEELFDGTGSAAEEAPYEGELILAEETAEEIPEETIEDITEAEVPETFAGTASGSYILELKAGTWVYSVNGTKTTDKKYAGLHYINGKTHFLNRNGTIARKAIVHTSGKYYSFDETGYCIAAVPEGTEGWIRRWDGWYWLQKSGELLRTGGVRRLGGKLYYLHPGSGRRASGFASNNGKYYYCWSKSGVLATGWFTVNGNTYYSLKDPTKANVGMVLKGWQRIGDTVYYFNTNGSMRTGWLDQNGGKYFFHENGARAGGFVKFSDGTRYFDEGKGHLYADRLFTIRSNTYYANGKGLLKSGWVTLNGKKYFFDRTTFVMKKNTILTENGKKYYLQADGSLLTTPGAVRISGTYYMADSQGIITACTEAQRLAINVLNQVGWNLRAAYNWSANAITYQDIGERAPYGYSEVDGFAIYGFRNRVGHCYVYACTFYQMAKVMGYEVFFVKGFVPSSTGGLNTHGWCEIYVNGKMYVMDCSFGRNGGEMGNGYLIQYGQRGTWRYTNYRRVA